jgi:serine/threonine-protein kinase
VLEPLRLPLQDAGPTLADRLPERASDPANLAGSIVATASNAYRVARPIAQGGFSVVYRARRSDPLGARQDRDVAIKVLDVERLNERLAHAPPAFVDPEAPLPQQLAEVRERFLNEGHLLCRLQHPGIVRGIDAGVLPRARGGAPFFVMEYLPGTDVEEIVRLRGRFDASASAAIAAALLAALAHLARNGIVHRDVKAANVFLQPSARSAPSPSSVRLIDFGLATAASKIVRDRRALFPHEVRTRPGMIWGTLAWCPPERLAPFLATGADAPESLCDLWGAGLLLYLCLTGVQPFDRPRFETDAEQFAAIIEGRLPPPRGLCPAVPPALEAVVRRALAPRPADRFTDAQEFLHSLRAATPGC